MKFYGVSRKFQERGGAETFQEASLADRLTSEGTFMMMIFQGRFRDFRSFQMGFKGLLRLSGELQRDCS